MADNPKDLQQMKESGATTLGLSTISNVHVTQVAAAEAPDVLQQLQNMEVLQDPAVQALSTISNVHVTKVAE